MTLARLTVLDSRADLSDSMQRLRNLAEEQAQVARWLNLVLGASSLCGIGHGCR